MSVQPGTNAFLALAPGQTRDFLVSNLNTLPGVSTGELFLNFYPSNRLVRGQTLHINLSSEILPPSPVVFLAPLERSSLSGPITLIGTCDSRFVLRVEGQVVACTSDHFSFPIGQSRLLNEYVHLLIEELSPSSGQVVLLKKGIFTVSSPVSLQERALSSTT